MTDERLCFASFERETIIDLVVDGRTRIYGKTLDEARAEYPDAAEMTVAAFCEWKAAKQRSPITWGKTTEEVYWEMLEVLPPAAMTGGWFLVGEPADHDAGSGEPRFEAFRQIGDRFEASSRPVTRTEFSKIVRGQS